MCLLCSCRFYIFGCIFSLRFILISLQICEQFREFPWYKVFFFAICRYSQSSQGRFFQSLRSKRPTPCFSIFGLSEFAKFRSFQTQLKRILFIQSILLQIQITTSLMSSSRSSSERSKSRGDVSRDKKKRYKYCCKTCKHAQNGKKSCVCVVPMSQRRAEIGQKGCQTCGCKGCSIEDFISRGEDPEYKPRQRENAENGSVTNDQKFDPKNGCCRKCMKAFSKIGKSCLCQVPKQVRMTKLSTEGCKICGCTGCNPRDNSESYSNRSLSPQQPKQVQRGEKINAKDYNLDNIDNSVLGKVIIVEYGLFPGMLGLGIPQRTPNYILGRPL